MIERLRTHLAHILNLRESAHRTALAFALGVVIAFSPTYGLHTLSTVFCAWAFRLNFIAIMAGSLINNPWTLVPILGLTFWVGFKITGTPTDSFDWENFDLSLGLGSFYQQVMPYVLSFVAGHLVLSVLGGMLSYPLAYFLISRYRPSRWRKHGEGETLPPESRLG